MTKCYLPITQNEIRIFLRGVTQEAFLGAAGSWTISLSVPSYRKPKKHFQEVPRPPDLISGTV